MIGPVEMMCWSAGVNAPGIREHCLKFQYPAIAGCPGMADENTHGAGCIRACHAGAAPIIYKLCLVENLSVFPYAICTAMHWQFLCGTEKLL